MRTMILSVAAATALLTLCVGCGSQRAQVARGQGPAGTYATAYGDPICDDECEVQKVKCRRCSCKGRGCSKCCGGCKPYCVPRDLSYPQAGPPAIVQYPYYTCKGPDCFFLQP